MDTLIYTHRGPGTFTQTHTDSRGHIHVAGAHRHTLIYTQGLRDTILLYTQGPRDKNVYTHTHTGTQTHVHIYTEAHIYAQNPPPTHTGFIHGCMYMDT